LAALEIKIYGAFGEATRQRVRRMFRAITAANPRIFCACVTLLERKGYKWAVSEASLGFPAFTLFFHRGSGWRGIEATGDWGRLLEELQHAVHSH